MDVRSPEGRLIGWYQAEFTPIAIQGAHPAMEIPAALPDLARPGMWKVKVAGGCISTVKMFIRTNHAEGWTALICDTPEALQALRCDPSFEPGPGIFDPP